MEVTKLRGELIVTDMNKLLKFINANIFITFFRITYILLF